MVRGKRAKCRASSICAPGAARDRPNFEPWYCGARVPSLYHVSFVSGEAVVQATENPDDFTQCGRSAGGQSAAGGATSRGGMAAAPGAPAAGDPAGDPATNAGAGEAGDNGEAEAAAGDGGAERRPLRRPA
jgi:hypothetical protein